MDIKPGRRVIATYPVHSSVLGPGVAQASGTVMAVGVGTDGRPLYTVQPDIGKSTTQNIQTNTVIPTYTETPA